MVTMRVWEGARSIWKTSSSSLPSPSRSSAWEGSSAAWRRRASSAKLAALVATTMALAALNPGSMRLSWATGSTTFSVRATGEGLAMESCMRRMSGAASSAAAGNPDDTRESIRANLEFAGKYVDWPYIQHPTPYPGTPMTKDFRARNLIVIDNMEEYDGTTAVVATQHLQPEEIEYERWRAERWMKTRHIPAVMAHEPLFVLRNGWRMLAHTD